MEKETEKPTIGILIIFIIFWLVSIPLFLYFAYLCGLSLLMIYEQILLWARSGISIDLSSYSCMTSPSKYCSNIISYPPFSFISEDFFKWLVTPQDWIGVHSIIKPLLKGIPIWLFSLVISGYLTYAFFISITKLPKIIKSESIKLKKIYKKKWLDLTKELPKKK